MGLTNTLADGFVEVGKGMNESVEPILLENTELSRAVNIDLTSGIAKTRPGFRELPIWTDVAAWKDIDDVDVDPMEYFEDGIFQGSSLYKYQEQDYIVIVSGQLLWRINLATHELELYGWAASINDIPHVNMTTPKCWFCQVEHFMLVQDGVNPPWILNGRAIRRSKGADVKGEVGVNAQLVVTTTGGVVAVDPVYSTESYRVQVFMQDLVDNLSVGDYCTVRFRDGTTQTGIITKIERFPDGEVSESYEIKFDQVKDWVQYGMKRFDNVRTLTQSVFHGMVSVGTLEMPEVPAGTATAYGHGRIFVVWGGKYLLAGDILQSQDSESVLKYTEIQYINEGGVLAVPAEMGEIKALTFLQNAMTGTGLGSLLVLCDNGVSAFAVQNPRSEWLNTNTSTILFTTNGATGPDAIQSVNNDLMFLSYDGLRSLRHTTSTVAGSGIIFENRTLSENIKKVWAESAQWAWEYSSMCYANNRIYFLTKAWKGSKLEEMPNKTIAYPDPYGLVLDAGQEEMREPIEEVRFKGIVSLSPVNASGLNQNIVFNGIWTGYEFLHIVSGNLQGDTQPIVISRDADGNMKLLSISDKQGIDGTTKTVSRIYTGAFDFVYGLEQVTGPYGKVMTARAALKRLEYMDIWISNIYSEAIITLYARPVGYPAWVLCGSFTVEAITSTVERINAWPQYRRKQRISIPRLQCDSVTGQDLMTSSEFQFCIQWSGGLQVDRALFFATLMPEEQNLACRQPQGRVQSATGFDDYDYVVGGVV
jgi:hypothetical protein